MTFKLGLLQLITVDTHQWADLSDLLQKVLDLLLLLSEFAVLLIQVVDDPD